MLLSYIYLCKKHCHLLCCVYKKNNSFLSFHSSIFHSKKFISILHVKWTGMKKGEQVENLKFWVNILFAATKIYISIFSLTHSLTSLMGSFHFLQWKIFFPIHWQILKILENGISQSFILSLNCDHPLLCESSILFTTVKLKLGHRFPQLINRFNIGILKCWSGPAYISKFFPIHKRWEIGIFERPKLHFQIVSNSLKSLDIEIVVPLPSCLVKWWGWWWSFSTMTCGVREEPIYD